MKNNRPDPKLFQRLWAFSTRSVRFVRMKRGNVLECSSPLELFADRGLFESAGGPAHYKTLSRHPASTRGFTLVEIVISLTIIIIIAAGSVPMFKGLREEQLAREPIIELVRLAKETRIRAMREKRPYQVAFYQGGFVASRYFSPYFQLSELTTFLSEEETGSRRLNPNADDSDSDLDAGTGEAPKTALPMAPTAPKLDDNWEEHYDLPQDVQYSLKFWSDTQETPVTGELVKLWVFQPTGICVPLKLHLDRQSATFDVEFGALTADITREVIDLK